MRQKEVIGSYICLDFETVLTSVEMDKVLGKSKRQILPEVKKCTYFLCTIHEIEKSKFLSLVLRIRIRMDPDPDPGSKKSA